MTWNWITLAEEAERAREGLLRYGDPGHAEALERYHRAMEAVWPPGFFDQLGRCQRGEPAALDDILEFVEVSPRFFRSGYVRDNAVRWMTRPPRSPAQTGRMRSIVLKAVERRLCLPTRPIAALARAVDSRDLRESLEALTASVHEPVRETALAVLDGLPGPPWDRERARRKRADDRVLSMLVTAQRRRSGTLLRRVLAIDPGALSSRARSYLACAFETAMNLQLIPDHELLTIARRLDGPAMERIWSWALARHDRVGDRARVLFAQVRGR